MPSIEGRATTADGTELLTRHWPAIDPWAAVLLVHGLGEHSGRYEHVGAQLAAAGIDAYGFDNRGNGGSGGRPGHVDRWSQYLDDLGERLAAVRSLAADRPVALYGHSLGGLIVAGYCLSDRPKPDLVVLSAPGLDSTLPGWKKRLAPVLGRIVPTLAIPNGIDGSTLSRDPSVAARMADDPRCVGVSSARFGAEALAEQVRVRAGMGRGLGVPTLVMHGSDDLPRPAVGVRWFRRRAADHPPHLPRPATRAPQRARGVVGRQGRHRLAAVGRAWAGGRSGSGAIDEHSPGDYEGELGLGCGRAWAGGWSGSGALDDHSPGDYESGLGRGAGCGVDCGPTTEYASGERFER